MDLNTLIFPAPKCGYTEKSMKNQLVWIPFIKD